MGHSTSDESIEVAWQKFLLSKTSFGHLFQHRRGGLESGVCCTRYRTPNCHVFIVPFGSSAQPFKGPQHRRFIAYDHPGRCSGGLLATSSVRRITRPLAPWRPTPVTWFQCTTDVGFEHSHRVEHVRVSFVGQGCRRTHFVFRRK